MNTTYTWIYFVKVYIPYQVHSILGLKTDSAKLKQVILFAWIGSMYKSFWSMEK